MEKISEKNKMKIPIFIVSNNGKIRIQAVGNGPEVADIHLNYQGEQIPKCFTSLLENSVTKISHKNFCYDGNFFQDEEKKGRPFLDHKVLHDYMEVCLTYKCKQCIFKSDNEKEFHQHCLNHLLTINTTKEEKEETTTYVYLCSNCNKAFNSIDETKVHMIDEHNLKYDTFGCDEIKGMIKTINVSIETEKDINNINKSNIKKKRNWNEIIQSIDPVGNINNLNYFCRTRNCKSRFRCEKDLKIHEKCHLDSEFGYSSKDLYRCFQCNELFNSWHTCSAHLYKVHEIDCDLLKCPVCEVYKTSLPLRLENHIRIHSDVRSFTCKFCGKTFKQASQLRNHIIVHAEKNGIQKPNWSKSKQCNICFKMYSDSKSLRKHKEEVHSKLRPFVCSICGHASARKAMLLMHQRQHTGHKPYQCRLCNFRTADHNSLRKHFMRHTGVRPYKCPHCDYTAIQSGSYKNHLKIVHPSSEGIYMCNICQYKTISEDNYVRHISDHLTGLIKDNLLPEETKLKNGDKLSPKSFFSAGFFLEDTSNSNADEKIKKSSDCSETQ